MKQGGSGRFASSLVCALGVVCFGACDKLPEAPNQPPSASFIYTPVSPILAGLTQVVFNATASRDPDGQIRSYVWNFGDGTPEQALTAPVTTHVFPDTPFTCLEVIYNVLLTVVDDQGDPGSSSQTVKVIELPIPTSPECQPKPTS